MTEAGRQPWYNTDGRPIPPYVVGVAGGSASGKTSIAKEVLKRLPNVSWVAIVSQDAFYRPLTKEEVEQAFLQNFDFDHPNAIDQDLLVQCIKDLKASRAVQIPVYSFTEHQRLRESTYLYGQAVIVVEGLFVLQDPALRDLLDLKIFVQTDPDIMLARRIRRDIVERGRSVDGVLDQYLRFVKPSFDTFVGPSARYADIIVPGMSNEVAIDVIAQHISKHLTRHRTLELPYKVDSELYGGMGEAKQALPMTRLRVGTAADGKPAHEVEFHPFPEKGTSVAKTTLVLPLPSNVCVIRHTRHVQALLTLMHDQDTASGDFAWACKRAGALVVEKAAELLPYRTKTIKVPTGESYDGMELDVDYICAVSILRSGAILEQRSLFRYSVSLPSFVRERSTAKRTWVFLTDAQIGTGAAAIMAVRVLLDHGVPEEQILLLTLLASARGGLWSLQHAFPRVRVITAGVDPGLRRFKWTENHDHYHIHHTTQQDAHGEHRDNESSPSRHEREVYAIVPGCGQFGDRFWGT